MKDQSMADLLVLTDIEKSFGTNRILHQVDFQLQKGQVHALLGANGAGKSTLMKIIAGEYTKDAGTIRIEGDEVKIQSPGQAKQYGISVIHQELHLVPEFTVAENVYLGKELVQGPGAFLLSRKTAIQKTQELLDRFQIQLDPLVKVKSLSIGQQQLVEILKAISEDSRVLVMDEPTATLTSGETQQLFAVIESLKAKGIGIIYISHRLDEIQQICDYVTIMKDGRKTAEGPIGAFSNERIIECMVGKQLERFYPSTARIRGNVLLEAKNLNKTGVLRDVSVSFHRGEVVGLFGLLGAGQSELLRVLFGVEPAEEGSILCGGKPVTIDSPLTAMKHRIALVTENRKEEGLVLELGADQNISLCSMPQFSQYGLRSMSRIKEMAAHYVQKLNIKLHSLHHPVRQLSGGNQQKVILGKWLLTSPDLILLSEPTRGIDVGARSEIYRLLDELAQEDKGIVIASSDADEIVGLCDRILVMFKGDIVAEVKKEEASIELLMEYASGARQTSWVEVGTC